MEDPLGPQRTRRCWMPRWRYMSEAEKTEIWDRHGRGEPLYVIARQIGRSLEGVRHEVNRRGGVRPQPRRRPRGALSAEEREEISRGLARNNSYRLIGTQIGRPVNGQQDLPVDGR